MFAYNLHLGRSRDRLEGITTKKIEKGSYILLSAMVCVKKLCEPYSCKLICKLPKGVTFAYDLFLGCSRDNLKGISER